jgi:hypothetical protein
MEQEFNVNFSPARETAPNMLRHRKNETPPTESSSKFGLLKTKNTDESPAKIVTASIENFNTPPSRVIKPL